MGKCLTNENSESVLLENTPLIPVSCQNLGRKQNSTQLVQETLQNFSFRGVQALRETKIDVECTWRSSRGDVVTTSGQEKGNSVCRNPVRTEAAKKTVQTGAVVLEGTPSRKHGSEQGEVPWLPFPPTLKSLTGASH